jgi:hypothetical protein
MTGAMKFKVQTDDDQGRLVQHRPILGSKAGALREALRRRYRLHGDYRVFLRREHERGAMVWRGTYEVFLGSFMKPAHSGWFMVEEVA